jgi:hypothetical protein
MTPDELPPRTTKLAGLKLRRSAHQLGYRGHSSLKSRGYSSSDRHLPPAGN